ncbi:MAG: choice-of-anchor L domain-containing protein, partial [Candidatus Promineifilaceae bacterium]
VSFDLAFLSEEFPEWVGSQYNDTFTAQLNNSFLGIDNDNQVVAPGNFAFDIQGGMISINTVWGVSAPTGTTYDGGTARIQAHTAVVPNSTIDIYLSIQDVGDSLYDSAVFLDNFFWSKDPSCTAGAAIDSDNDGLLDDWETSGLTVMVGGVPEFVDLPAMGADPMHKDVFVETDYMQDGGHTHRPKDSAIAEIVQSFNDSPVNNPDGTTGIHLHVDYGPTAPLTWGSAPTWGSLSRADALTHQDFISTCTVIPTPSGEDFVVFNWDGFNAIKTANFGAERASVFHYNVWAHSLCNHPKMVDVSGISRNTLDAAFGDGASDFIVSLGLWHGGVGTINEQAGTFMHELGHNLGLRHGGPDHINYKPNYLSVMNYSFQTHGLTINGVPGNFDYSRYDMAELDESNLDEPDGIGVPGSLTDLLGTSYFCGAFTAIDNDARAVDWNCDRDESDTGLVLNINGDFTPEGTPILSVLTTQNDWDNLVFLGGAIGRLGAAVEMPSVGDVIDINVSEDAWLDVTSAVYLPIVIRN